MTDLSIVIVNWNTRDLLAQCLDSIREVGGDLPLEVIVVDNASTDGSVEMMEKRFPEVRRIVNEENEGFVQANNQALSQCQGRTVLLLNSDTRLLPGALEVPLRFMEQHPKVGMVGVKLLNDDRSFQASYTPFPTLWREFLILSGLGRRLIRPSFPSHGPPEDGKARPISGYVEGAYMLARRRAIEEVGGLDERIFMYAEDVDWCYRFEQSGWEIWFLPQVSIIHYGGQSTCKRQRRMEAELYRSRVYFFEKHYGRWTAAALRAMIYVLTGVKIVVYRGLRLVTGGKRGRLVTSWRELRWALKRTE